MTRLHVVQPEEGALVKTKKVHANLAPSKAHRWLVCPGSQYVSTDDPETEWAAEGTRKHAVLELILQEHHGKLEEVHGPLVIAGDTVQTECGPYVVPLEVLEQCYEVRDFIEQFQKTHVDGWVVETETKVEVGSYYWPNMPRGECAGTTDAAAYSYDELLVLDAKFGFLRVQPRGNPQLLLYAAGLLSEIPFPIKWVTLCIAQPGYDGLMEFREHRMTAEAVVEWMFQQLHAVEENQAGSRRLQADDHACLWCPARAQCPERLRALDEAMAEDWLVSRSLEELLPYVPRLKAIAKDIEQRAVAEMSQGKPVRGWKVVAAKSRRAWSDDGAADRIAKDVLEYEHPPEEMFERELKSPAQIEKFLYAHFAKNKTKKEVAEIVNKYAFAPAGAPKLAPESDPRPALEPATWTLEDALRASLEDDFNAE
jgi:hypothetical protein